MRGTGRTVSRRKRDTDVAVVIADASPILTLARVGRLDLLATFDVPIHIVDQVFYEITKSGNDPRGEVKSALARLHNKINIVETATGTGFRALRERNPGHSGRGLGEQAVSEYAMKLSKTTGPSFVPLVLFEDPDVLDLPIAALKDVHLLNTTAWLFGLYRIGCLPEGLELIAQIDNARKTPMRPFEKPARTKKIRSAWQRKLQRHENG